MCLVHKRALRFERLFGACALCTAHLSTSAGCRILFLFRERRVPFPIPSIISRAACVLASSIRCRSPFSLTASKHLLFLCVRHAACYMMSIICTRKTYCAYSTAASLALIASYTESFGLFICARCVFAYTMSIIFRVTRLLRLRKVLRCTPKNVLRRTAGPPP